jgi:glucose/arabinose dehydrogenase
MVPLRRSSVRPFRGLLIPLIVLTLGCDSSSGPRTGRLVVDVSGLPAGTAAEIRVTGPANFDQRVTATAAFEQLEPGTYAVSITPVTVGGTTYTAAPAQQSVDVAGGRTATAQVLYLAFGLDLQLVVQGLANPVFLTTPPGDNTRLFVVEQPGRVRIVKGGQLLATPFLDITSRVRFGGEQGLLSMAFDPSYATNGRFYVYYTNPQFALTIERYEGTPGADVASTTATPVLSIPHPVNTNHNGGLLMFGPDGMLYIGTGDGGSAGDPPGNAQNINSLLGKLLRIDVRTLPYTPQGTTREIWATGLRNPWRWDFRQVAGNPGRTDLYIADVGQGAWEEINFVLGNPGGLNYGWNRLEGNACYPPSTTGCSTTGLTMPVHVYSHSEGCSITGGFVYRGTAIPEIQGDFLFSDYCSGFLASLRGDPTIGFTRIRWTIPNIGNVSSFGEDASGEQYMLTSAGQVHKIVPKR